MKGTEQLRSKLPGLHGHRVALLPLLALSVGASGLLFLIVIDLLPRLIPGNLLLKAIEPVLPILGGIVLAIIALILVTGLWRNREKALERYGSLAYQKQIPRGMSGVVLVVSVVIHSYLSVRSLIATPPANEITTILSQSMLSLIGIPTTTDILLRLCLSIPVTLLGILIVRSSLMTFGIDYMMVLYLFFPEESKVQKSEIYSVIRHPTYFAGVLMGIGGFLFRMSIYSLAFAAITYLIFRIHLTYEETELIERFGESYRQYMQEVPGLHVRARDLRILARFAKGPSTSA